MLLLCTTCGEIKNSDQHHLISVPKASIHLYDADSGEIALSQDVPELERLATHGNTIRFRMLNSDSPETEYSIRIYKQSEHNVQMSPFLTRHIGIECMRAARQMLFEATAVYLGVGEDHRGELLLQRDHHGRMLVNIFLEDSNGEKENFAQKLASHGYTLSFYTTGIESGINQAMREAIAAKIGIFNLPDEAFAYPFRPWDVRTLTRKEAENPIDYDAKREILNTPSDPASAWKPQGTITPVDGGEEDGSMPESESTDTFFLKMVTCKLFFETKCFAARSTIPNAGTGLFIKPHRTIPVGQHLCLYAEQSTEPMETSSKVYAMQTARHNLHFDAEIETGNNIGRFANQPGVMEAFDQIKEMSHKDKPQMTEDDWRRIEKELNDMCNAEFSVVLGQLVLKAKRQFDETFNATEVFVNYGGLRQYWIPLIIQRDTSDLVPNRMIEIVEWLFHSEECNWTQEQRRDWSAR